MDMHVASAETLAGGEMEVSDNLVDANLAFNAASFVLLRIELFGVMLPLALFDILTTSKRPLDGGVSLTDFVASLTASRFLGVLRGGCTIARTTVLRIQMGCLVSMSVGVSLAGLLQNASRVRSPTQPLAFMVRPNRRR
jgi:hypothetical protein